MIKYEIDKMIHSKKIEDIIKVPKIITVNEFTESSVRSFRTDFSEAVSLEQPFIPIIIDSFGGAVYSLMAMIDLIKSSPVPVATFVSGKAMSCGALLFSYGTDGYRVVSPYANVLIHDVSSGSFGKVEDIKADAAHIDKLNQFVYRELARNCGKHESYFLDLVHEKGHADWYLTPDDCVKHNLANRVGHFKMNVELKANITFG